MNFHPNGLPPPLEWLPPAPDVLCADEKTQIPIRTRCHAIVPPAPGRAMRVEHEYRRHGVCAYLAAWDVHRARLFGRVVKKIAIAAFDAEIENRSGLAGKVRIAGKDPAPAAPGMQGVLVQPAPDGHAADGGHDAGGPPRAGAARRGSTCSTA